MWSALRIRAPTLQPSEELRWVLLRAFAPLDAPVPRVILPSKVVTLSRDLDLAARIATRHASGLAEELGAEAARDLSFHRLQVIAVDRVLSTLSDEILQTAEELGCPVVWLKYAALRRLGLIAEGERAARDVDLLVPQTLASPLQKALLARGFRGAHATPQLHLPPLQRAAGEVVEIHAALWGLALPGLAQSALGVTAASMIAHDFVARLPDGSYTPSKAMLAAHAIVHGLVQHRTSPEGYPIMRALADLCSLGYHESQQCMAFAGHPLASALTLPALRLTAALRGGEDVFELPASSPEFQLLSHAVAAGVDPAYRRALRFERVFELASADAVRRSFRSAFSAADSATPPGSADSTVLPSARIARPIALALELVRGAASYGVLRLRPRHR